MNDNSVSFAFPWSVNLKVGDVVGLETGYVFQGNIFNGKHIGDAFKFIGMIDAGLYEEDRYNRMPVKDIFVFERVEKQENRHNVCGGRFSVSTYYHAERITHATSDVRIDLRFDPFLWGNSVQDIMDAYGYKNILRIQ